MTKFTPNNFFLNIYNYVDRKIEEKIQSAIIRQPAILFIVCMFIISLFFNLFGDKFAVELYVFAITFTYILYNLLNSNYNHQENKLQKNYIKLIYHLLF